MSVSNTYGQVSTPAPAIKTKIELDNLKSQRTTPSFQIKPEPPRGAIAADLQKEAHQQTENRISDLSQTLQQRHEQINSDRLKAVHSERAQNGFNRVATTPSHVRANGHSR